MNRPQTLGELETFLGLFPFYAEYLERIYIVLAPLFELKKKSALRIDGQLGWNDEHEAAFLKAKELISAVPCILIPDPSKRFRLEIDACTEGGSGLGAVLKQQDNKGEWRPCAYWSHALTPEEKNSSSATMAEARAMHDAIQHFSQ